MDANEVLNELWDTKGYYSEDARELLKELAPQFLSEIDRQLEEEDLEFCFIDEASKKVFVGAFEDELSSREVRAYLRSHLLKEKGFFYEMFRWYLFFMELGLVDRGR